MTCCKETVVARNAQASVAVTRNSDNSAHKFWIFVGFAGRAGLPDSLDVLIQPHWGQSRDNLPRSSEIMAEKRELESLASAAMKQAGRARAAKARATMEMALELAERKSKREEYDEHLVTFVDGSYIPRNRSGWETGGLDEGQSQEAGRRMAYLMGGTFRLGICRCTAI